MNKIIVEVSIGELFLTKFLFWRSKKKKIKDPEKLNISQMNILFLKVN